MLSWFKCVLLKGGHRYGRWWWLNRQDGAGSHHLCDECGGLCTPADRNRWAWRERAQGVDAVAEDVPVPMLMALGDPRRQSTVMEWVKNWEAHLASTGQLAAERAAFEDELIRLGESAPDASRSASTYIPDPKMLGQAAHAAGERLALKRLLTSPPANGVSGGVGQ